MAVTTGNQFTLIETSMGSKIEHLGFYPISDFTSTVALGESHNLSGILAFLLYKVGNTINFNPQGSCKNKSKWKVCMNGTKSPHPGILGIISITMYSAFSRDKLSAIFCNSFPNIWVLVPIPSLLLKIIAPAVVSCVPVISIKHAGISPTFKTKNSAWTPHPRLPLFSCSFQHSSLKGMALLSPRPFSPAPHSTQGFVSSTPENHLFLMISIMPSGQFSFFIWPLFSPSFLEYFLLWASSEAQVSYFSFYPRVSPFQTPFLSFHHPIFNQIWAPWPQVSDLLT